MMTYQQVKKLRNRVVHKSRTVAKNVPAAAVDPLDAVTLPETEDDDETTTGGAEDCYYQSDEETAIAQAMARAVFTNSTPMLNLLLKAAFREEQEERNQQKNITTNYTVNSSSKRSRDHDAITSSTTMITQRQQPTSSTSSTRSFKKARRTTSPAVRLSASAPSLKCLAKDEEQQSTKSSNGVKPSEKLQSLLSEAGYTYKTYDYTSLSTMGFFIKLTSAQINLYDTDLVRTVRDQDLTALQERRAVVPSLHAGNKFGETILHASCRRAAFPMVQYLLADGGHPVRVCCDYGRTVLHDAAWTCTPNLAVIDLLLNVCPDLLYVCDRRGYTALDYIPKDQYSVWCDYLTTRTAERLRPVVLQSSL
jgi:Ankyrin repeats (3 copies)